MIAARYRVVDAIGRGGMGEVYRATDVVLGREVAVKVMLPIPNTVAAGSASCAKRVPVHGCVIHMWWPLLTSVSTARPTTWQWTLFGAERKAKSSGGSVRSRRPGPST